MIYADFDQTELDLQYNAEKTVPSVAPYFDRNNEESERARALHPGRLDVAYGPSADETLDVFPAPHAGGPIVVYVHGGYWRRLHKDNFSYVASGFIPHGAHVVVVNYALAPAVGLDEIVRQVRAAIAWTAAHASEFGGDPAKLVAIGHSAGGQLVGMAAATDWSSYGLAPGLVSRVASLSGLHDLAPVALSYVNEWMHLQPADVQRNSPVLHLPSHPARLVAAVGENETDEFKRQTRLLAAAYESAGHRTRALELEDRNHYSIVLDLADPQSRLTLAIVEELLTDLA